MGYSGPAPPMHEQAREVSVSTVSPNFGPCMAGIALPGTRTERSFTGQVICKRPVPGLQQGLPPVANLRSSESLESGRTEIRVSFQTGLSSPETSVYISAPPQPVT